MQSDVTTDLCKTLDWNPIAAASAQSAIGAVLAGFVFAGIIVVLSVRAHSLKRESAQALKLLFTAFFGLAVTAYLLADMAGEQTCPRAETIEGLAGGALGAFSVIMIAALTWLVVAYQQHEHDVLRFLHGLVYISCAFVLLLLCTNATTYVGADVPQRSNTAIDIALYSITGVSFVTGVLFVWHRRRRQSSNNSARDLSVTSDGAVNRCALAALTYLFLSSLATGVAAGLPAKMWYPHPAVSAIYVGAVSSLTFPVIVLAFAIGGLARTEQVPRQGRHTAMTKPVGNGGQRRQGIFRHLHRRTSPALSQQRGSLTP